MNIKKEILSGVEKYLDKALDDYTENRKMTIDDLSTKVRLRDSIDNILMLESDKKLTAFVEPYLEALNESVREELLVESFISGLNTFSYLDAADTELSALKGRADKLKQEIDLVKIVDQMKNTGSAYLVDIIEDRVACYVENKTASNKNLLLSLLSNFEYDDYVRLIMEIVRRDTSIENFRDGGLINEQVNLSQYLTTSDMYSPVLYLNENACLFNVGGNYYTRSKKGDKISRIKKEDVAKLNKDFHLLCEAVNLPNVLIKNGAIEYMYGNDILVDINENELLINGKRANIETLMDPNLSYLEYGINDYDFAFTTKVLYEGFHKIANVDFVKRFILNENNSIYADLFTLGNYKALAIADDEMVSTKFYSNVNNMQQSTILNEHFGINVSKLFESEKDNEFKEKVQETKNKYETKLQEFVETRNELIKLEKEQSGDKELLTAIKSITDDIKELKNKYLTFQKNVRSKMKPNQVKHKDIKELKEDDGGDDTDNIKNYIIEIEGKENVHPDDVSNPIGDEESIQDTDFDMDMGMQLEPSDDDMDFGGNMDFDIDDFDFDFDSDDDMEEIDLDDEDDEDFTDTDDDGEFETPDFKSDDSITMSMINIDDMDDMDDMEDDMYLDDIDNELGYDPASLFDPDDLENGFEDFTSNSAVPENDKFKIDRIEFTRDIKGKLGTCGYIVAYMPEVDNGIIKSMPTKIEFSICKDGGEQAIDNIKLSSDVTVSPEQYHQIIGMISNTTMYRDVMASSKDDLLDKDTKNSKNDIEDLALDLDVDDLENDPEIEVISSGLFESITMNVKAGKNKIKRIKRVIESEEDVFGENGDFSELEMPTVNLDVKDIMNEPMDNGGEKEKDHFLFLLKAFEQCNYIFDTDDDNDMFVEIKTKEDILLEDDIVGDDMDLAIVDIDYNGTESEILIIYKDKQLYIVKDESIISSINAEMLNDEHLIDLLAEDEDLIIIDPIGDVEFSTVIEYIGDKINSIIEVDGFKVDIVVDEKLVYLDEALRFYKMDKGLEETNDLITYDAGDSFLGKEGEFGSDIDKEMASKVEIARKKIESKKGKEESLPKIKFIKGKKPEVKFEEKNDLFN